jgi:hypothetical protein
MITQSNRIIGEIAAEKEVLGQNLQELETRVRSVADWRGQVQRRPLAMMGLALGGGILLSALVGSPRRRKRRVVSNEQLPDDRRTEPVSALGDETWDRFKGALLAVATSKAAALVEDAIPGFREEFTRGGLPSR